jgi:hypothetical protein
MPDNKQSNTPSPGEIYNSIMDTQRQVDKSRQNSNTGINLSSASTIDSAKFNSILRSLSTVLGEKLDAVTESNNRVAYEISNLNQTLKEFKPVNINADRVVDTEGIEKNEIVNEVLENIIQTLQSQKR